MDSATESTVTYFIQAAHGGPIKIGRSNTEAGARKRLDTLQTGSPYPLVLCRVMFGNHESQLHGRFAKHRLMGEWFTPVKELALLASGKAEDEGEEIASVQNAFTAGHQRGYGECTEGWRESLGFWLQHMERALEDMRGWLEVPEGVDHRYDGAALAFKEYVAEKRNLMHVQGALALGVRDLQALHNGT